MRVLVSNIFFAPQSIGGATRVVQDNICDFNEIETITETAVFSGLNGGTESGQLRHFRTLGTTVCATTTRLSANADFNLSDPAIRKVFSDFLDYFQPDLIHFHCIQRLTSDIVQEALERGIPYLITMHDGWWISDHQFCLNAAGDVALYDYAKPSMTTERFGEAALERQAYLLPVLEGAARLLTVSETFKAVIQSAGLPDITVTPNGIMPRTPLEKTSSEKLVIGYLAGVAEYKGYHHMRAAFSRGNYPNLKLVMVNHALGEGETYIEHWGRTEVEVTGFVPQAKVGELYARLDAVIVPSIWPESFGLVAREALQAKCWLFASCHGAAAEDVVEGRNGHVFDPRDRDSFAGMLEMTNLNTTRYKTPPEAVKLTSSRAQAKQLAEIYQQVLS